MEHAVDKTMAMGVDSRYVWHIESVSIQIADLEFFLDVSSRKLGWNGTPFS
jgi:hypothetical protein